MAIHIIDGYPGHGKTAYGVVWLRRLLNERKRVFTDIKLYPQNMNLKWAKKDLPLAIEGNLSNEEDRNNPNKLILYWKHFDEWQWMQQGTIFCDEGGVKFNSRRFEALPEEIQNKLMQHRHDRLDLILTAPHHSRIDLILRQMADRIIHAQLIFGSEKFDNSIRPRISKITDWRLEDMIRIENLGQDSTLVGEPIRSEFFHISKKIFKYYDTSEIVGESRVMPRRILCRDHNVTYCPECQRSNKLTLAT